MMMRAVVLFLVVSQAGAILNVRKKSSGEEKACQAQDLQHRMQLQNKLAGVCEDMCKEVGAYPKCSQCPNFVPPDATPGITTPLMMR